MNMMRMFREDCISGLIVNERRCSKLLDESHALATVLNPYIGYDIVAQLVKTALSENISLKQVLVEKDIIPGKYLDDILDAVKMTQPRKIDDGIIDEIIAYGKKNRK